MDKPFVHVFQNTLVHPQDVDPNALVAQNVHWIKHVSIKSVRILVLVSVVQMPDVMLTITVLFAPVNQDTQEIHSVDVIQFHVRNYRSNLNLGL